MIKKMIILGTVFVSLVANADKWTDPATGIEWTYSVVSNKAVVGDVVTTNYTSAICRDTEGDLVIPSEIAGFPVVDIAPYAFSGCTNITAVIFPDAVTNISRCAFSAVNVHGQSCLVGYETTTITSGGTTSQMLTPIYYTTDAIQIPVCEKLGAVMLPQKLQIIRADAFAACCSLSNVVFCDSVQTIENGAFSKCEKLTALHLPPGILHLGGSPAQIRKKVSGYTTTTTTTGGTATQIMTTNYSTYVENNGGRSGWGVFEGCTALKEINMPGSVREIGFNAFKRCKSLQSVNIPDSVIAIRKGAFSECGGLPEVTLPSRLTTVDESVSPEEGLFFGCTKLRAANVSVGITELPNYTFANCVSLKALNFAGDKPAVNGNELLVGTPADMVVNVKGDACGWYDPITYGRLSVWQHRRVAYDGVLPPESAEMTDDDARLLLDSAIDVMSVSGTALSDDEKIEWLYCIENIVDRHPCLLSSARFAVEALGVDLSDRETTVFAKWALSVASQRLSPASEPVSDEKSATTASVEAKLTVTNVVLHYVVNSVASNLAVPITTDTAIVNVMTEIRGGNIAIPESWTKNYPSFKTVFGSDFTVALTKASGKIDAGGSPMFVWQDFVAGTDPTDASDIFTASVTIVDGKPIVSYSPELSDVEKAKRKYTTWGKVKLQDADWVEIPIGSESDYNFFKVTVEMR